MRPHLCHVFPAYGNGGPEVRTAIVINATGDTFRHSVVSISGDVSGAQRIANGHVERMPEVFGRLSYVRVLAATLRRLSPDLLITYGWGGVDALIVGRLCGFGRIIHGEDGFLPDEADGQKWHRLLARRLALRAASRVIVPSTTLVDVADRLWRLPHGQTCYVPNGVDAARFAPPTHDERAEARRKFGFADGEVVVGTVGHLRPEKNYGRLIDAYAKLPHALSARLLIVGDGSLRSTLDEQVIRLGLTDRVVFTGALANPVECYRAMDLFALSSDTEQMPLVILEAMSAGLPVVSTDVGDVRAMLPDGHHQYVTPLGDDDAFARALRTLMEDASERAGLGRVNRSRCVEEYDLRLMVERYRALYSDVLQGVQRPLIPAGSLPEVIEQRLDAR